MSNAVASADPRIPVQVHRLIDLARAIQHCKTPEDRARLAELHTKFAQERRDNEDAKDAAMAPILKKERDTRAPFMVVIQTCELWEKYCKTRMSAYDQEQLRLARLKQEEENRKVAERNAKIIEKAEAAGTAPITVAPKVVDTVAKTIQTDIGASTRKTVKRWRLKGLGPDEDVAKVLASDPRAQLIERENLLINASRINGLVKLGGHEAALAAQGIEVYEEFDYSGRGGKS